MLFCLFYIDNKDGLSVDELKKALEANTLIMESVCDDVVKSSFVYVPYGEYDCIVLADVQRDGGRWKPIKSTHIRISKDGNGLMLM